ncbi:MAG: branched-chain amino acid ABC transporter permease [Candidatus Aenigmarchaeota archaeon]|nr:branched-chain amino acid ABC transporter permease [Candidatus Aenigmarchaeota archaeon]
MVLEQLIVNGIIAGGIYALVAIGFSMTYGLLRFLNIAHGSLYVIGAYLAFVFFSAGLHIVGAFILAVIGGALAGVVMNYSVYKPLRKKKSSSLIMLLASLGIFIFVENFIIAAFGAEVRTIRTGPVTQGMDFLGAIITQTQVVIIIVSLLTLLLVELFLLKTKTGKAMRATADNKDVAQVVGINVERITTYTFALASALAASAGVLIAIEQNLEPTMGFTAIIKGFTAGVVGGLGSVRGAVAGAFLLGLVENIGIWFLPSGYKDAIAFVVLVIFLLFRPQGIFGRKEA